MNRYNQAKDKKSGVGKILVTIIVFTLASAAGWHYLKNQQSDAVTQPETRILALPSGAKEAAAIEPPVNEPLVTPVPLPDGIVELHQESWFILPDLANSDALLRQELTGISPSLAEWLDTDQLISKYVTIANDFSQGLRLEKHLRFLEPDQPFAVDRDNGGLFIAAKSYRRYDRLAAAINGLDVQATLAAYKKFRPLLLQVFREFSYLQEYSLEDVFTKAAAVILAAPAIDGQIALVRDSSHYKFADQQLEASSPIHKQMLRMGPENTRIIQNKLRLLVGSLDNLKE